MAILENIWWLLVLIGVMIVIHELGHYWAARFFDVHVETFSIGFGPRLIGFRRGETDFKISWIPLGGYVKMAGEQPGEDSADPRGFLMKPRWQRLIVVFAGPAMNIVLAIALMAGLYMYRYPKMASAMQAAEIGHVKEDSPAAKAGLKEGDLIVRFGDKADPTWEDVMLAEVVSANKAIPLLVRRGPELLNINVTPELDPKLGIGVAGWSERTQIQLGGLVPGMDAEKKGLRKGDLLLSINGQPIYTVYKIHEVLKASNGAPVNLVYERDGRSHEVVIQPKFSEVSGQGKWMMGVELAPRVIYTRLPVGEALEQSVKTNIRGATLIYQFLQAMIERRSSPKSLDGPIRIAQMSGEAARDGAHSFVNLMATVSLNLAIFNLLPIPILDGGVILLLLIEMLIRRDLSLQVKEAVFKVGFVFLMMLVVFVLYNDITKVLPG